LARPQALSLGSQTPLLHTDAPAAAVHAPPRAGVWPVTVGTGEPLPSFGVHAPVPVLHHCVAAQSVSWEQPPLEAPHVPWELHVAD
jgi:hypothetical protein